jgi:hypothetical protein
MGIFFQKTAQVFQMSEPLGNGERASRDFSHGLLHRLDFDFHDCKVVSGAIGRQRCIATA